jgi:ATP-dependent RNA helicase DHX8/PRP22
MSRAAAKESSIAKERRELRQQQKSLLKEENEDKVEEKEEEKKYKPVEISKNEQKGKRSNLTIKEQREGLPIFKYRNDFLKAISKNQILVLIGETGSGKVKK